MNKNLLIGSAIIITIVIGIGIYFYSTSGIEEPEVDTNSRNDEMMDDILPPEPELPLEPEKKRICFHNMDFSPAIYKLDEDNNVCRIGTSWDADEMCEDTYLIDKNINECTEQEVGERCYSLTDGSGKIVKVNDDGTMCYVPTGGFMTQLFCKPEQISNLEKCEK